MNTKLIRACFSNGEKVIVLATEIVYERDTDEGSVQLFLSEAGFNRDKSPIIMHKLTPEDTSVRATYESSDWNSDNMRWLHGYINSRWSSVLSGGTIVQ